jgi:SAM-dependent methyltransferase
MDYFLPTDYQARLKPEYFADEGYEGVWQPDVYPEAASLGKRLGARTIIDIGCGFADKLVALHPEFEIVGIDYGSNIDVCRQRYGFGRWLEIDLDHEDLPDVLDFKDALLVCADVIEHVVHPERLLEFLSKALSSGGVGLVLSTPDRELASGAGHLGPPVNPSHVREWKSRELEAFLASAGLEGHFGRTRTNDIIPALRTILAVVPGNTEHQRAAVAEWFEERRRWQRVPEAMDSSFAKYEAWVRDLQAYNEWLKQRCDRLEAEREVLRPKRARRR